MVGGRLKFDINNVGVKRLAIHPSLVLQPIIS